MGYLFRMLTWTIQASFITLSLYRVWTSPWFASRRRGVRAMSACFAVALMSCWTRLVLLIILIIRKVLPLRKPFQNPAESGYYWRHTAPLVYARPDRAAVVFLYPAGNRLFSFHFPSALCFEVPLLSTTQPRSAGCRRLLLPLGLLYLPGRSCSAFAIWQGMKVMASRQRSVLQPLPGTAFVASLWPWWAQSPIAGIAAF